MSDSPALELVPVRQSSVDVSGQPFSRSPSLETQVAPVEEAEAPLEDQPTEPTEKDVETESETVESDDEVPVEKVTDEYDSAIGTASILLLGGMLLAGAAYFLNQPLRIEHPHTMRDYF